MLTSTWWPVVAVSAAIITAVMMLLARHMARTMVGARHGLRPTPVGAGLVTAEPVLLGRRCARVLLAGVAALLGVGAADPAAVVVSPLPDAAAVVVGLTALGTALIVLTPRRVEGGGRILDGVLLLEWWRWPAVAKRRIAVDLLEELARQGRRPKSWPETWVQLAVGEPDGAANGGRGPVGKASRRRSDVRGCWYGYLWAMDSGRAGVARALLERALRDGTGRGGPHPRLLAECAFHVAWVWGDAGHAEALLTLLPNHPSARLERLRAMAAIDLAHGDAERAAVAARAWLEATAANGHDRRPAVTAVVREWVQALKAEADAAAATRVS